MTTVAENPAQRHCQECGKAFAPNRPQQVFCTPAHKTAFWNRQAKRGKVLMPLLLTMTNERRAPSGSEDAELCSYARNTVYELAAIWNAEDKDAGRPPMKELAALKKEAGWRACDLEV